MGSDTDREVLERAKEKARTQLDADPTSEKLLRAFDLASTMLEKRTQAPSEMSFTSRVDVWKWIRGQGYRLGRSRFYQHCPEAGGMLKIETDGTILISSVVRYIKAAKLVRLGGAAMGRDGDNRASDKLDADIERTVEATKKIRFDRKVAEGHYVLLTDMQQQQAIKAGALSVGLDHMFTVRARESIRLAGGDLRKAQAVIGFWKEAKASLLDEFAQLTEVDADVFDDGE